MNGIEWLRPAYLIGLVLVPVATAGIVWSVKRRRRALDRFADTDVRRRTQELPAGRRGIRGGLLVLGLAGLVLAAAGPQWGTAPVTAVPVGQEVVFAIDVSRSMLARDVDPSRLDRARRVVRQLMAMLPSAETGLVVFAGEASLAVPLTQDASAIELYLGSAGPDWISDPSTDLGRAIEVALGAFGPERAPGRAVVVLSDGEDHGSRLEATIDLARERGIEIETVGVGTEEGSRIPLPGGDWVRAAGEPVVTRLEREALEETAEATGGIFARAGDEPSLARLGARLSRLDTGRREGRSEERQADRYRWPLALAVLALAGEAILALRSRRLPAEMAAVLAALILLAMGRPQDPEELYEEGRYQDALRVWRANDRSANANPSDAYNRASAAYRLGRHREAAASYAVAARTALERARAEAAWYNTGNGRFRMAEEVESTSAERSLPYWDSAVAAYREALVRDPDDRDAKHNLELALRRRDEAAGDGGGSAGGGEGQGGGAGGGGTGAQPPSSGTSGSPGSLTRDQAERLLDALAAQEQEALIRGGDRRADQAGRPGW
ncbi:MAG: VWA domain-containing protein [Gemmatimonadota bacterium]